MKLRKFIATTIYEYLNEQQIINQSTSNYDMVDKLKELSYVKYVDRPSGLFLHDIDLTITDIKYLDDLYSLFNDNN